MFKQYINGQCVEGKGNPFQVFNPATDEVIETLNGASPEQVLEALTCAKVAFPKWAKTPLNDRIALLNKFRDACIQEKETIAMLIHQEVGLSYPESLGEVDTMTTQLQFNAEEVRRVYGTTIPDYIDSHGEVIHIVEPFPIGVTVGHIAWNHPLYGAGVKLASLYTGCTCILKPSSNTPLATLYLGVIAQKVGLPAGVLNILAGPSNVVGKMLNESDIPSLIGVIGSSETGREVMRQGATTVKRYSLELGGNAPAIVMPDASLDLAIPFIVKRKTWSCGQGCSNINRIYVHEDIHDEFVARLLEKVSQVKVGWGKELGDVMGPQMEKKYRDALLDKIQDAVEKGAKIVYGGGIPKGLENRGAFIMPTILDDCDESMRVCNEELFGPVFSIYRFSDLDDVIEKANNTTYGLAAYVYTHDSRVFGRCAQEIQSGMVYINTPTCGGANLPHIGIKQSGIGCDAGKWQFDNYYVFKRVSIRI